MSIKIVKCNWKSCFEPVKTEAYIRNPIIQYLAMAGVICETQSKKFYKTKNRSDLRKLISESSSGLEIEKKYDLPIFFAGKIPYNLSFYFFYLPKMVRSHML